MNSLEYRYSNPPKPPLVRFLAIGRIAYLEEKEDRMLIDDAGIVFCIGDNVCMGSAFPSFRIGRLDFELGGRGRLRLLMIDGTVVVVFGCRRRWGLER